MKFSITSLFGAAEQALIPSLSVAERSKATQEDSAASFKKSDRHRLHTIKRNAISLVNKQNDADTLPSKDFDEDPTELYRLIQMKRWSRTLEVLEKFPEDAKVWIYRLEADHVTVRWRLLPLHAALILKAPDTVVEALLLAFAGAAKMRDDQGSLPLHIVCKVGNVPLVAEMLITAYPQAITDEDGSSRNPAALLALFNPPNKTPILALVKKHIEESLAVETSFTAERERYADVVSPTERLSIEVHPDEMGAITTKSVTSEKNVWTTEARDPPETSNKYSIPQAGDKAEVRDLTKLQKKHKDELIAITESMDLQNDVSKANEDATLKKKLETVELKHMNELEQLKQQSIKYAEEARAKEEALLRAQLEEVQAKYEAEMLVIQRSQTEVEQADSSKTDRSDQLARLEEEVIKLKAQHEKEIEVIKKTAEQEREAARREEREIFQGKLAQFEAKHKSIVETIKTESLVEREKSREAEFLAFERQVETINARHQQELQAVEERLIVERQALREDHEKLFDNRIREIEEKHNKDLEEFQFKLAVAQEAAREERTRIIEDKLKELQSKHAADLKNIEKKSLSTMNGLECTISNLKKELEKASTLTNEQNADFLRSIRGLEDKLVRTNDKAADKVAVLEQTVECLEASLRDARKHSLFLEDHVHNLEDQIEERNEKDLEFEARLNKIQRSWMCGFFGG